jgi:pyruvate dehydrogenase E2 component (dihydrolipoamide acetyltransferase)
VLEAISQTILATPSIRQFAREQGIHLNQVAGSGPYGRITREDVATVGERHAVPLPTPTPPTVAAAVPTTAAEERIPLRGIRRKIAQQMVKAKFTAPDFFYADEADVTDLVAYRSEVAPLMKAQGVKLTYLAFLVKAVVSALKAYPEMNASLDDEAQEIVLKREYHVGIATAAEHGLVVPVIKHADRLGLRAIAQEIERLSTAVREGKATPQELSGGTFTITNIGVIGGLVCAPIINHPEVGILGFNKIYQKPVVYQGEIVPRWVTTLSLSCDHRVVDGAEGARFVSHILQLLQNPKLLVLE